MDLALDLQFAYRTLCNSPGFALTSIVTMALGIGATTATFSVADAMLWKPIPLPHLESLVIVVGRVPDDPKDFNDLTPADAEDIRTQTTTFDAIASYQQGLANISGSAAQPERVNQALVTANFFDVLGVRPAHGRGFQAGEDQPGREREVVLTDGLWRQRFGGDPNIIGKSIRVDDEEFRVVGVMPAKVEFPLATDIWSPIALTPEQRNSRRSQSLTAMARLKPGATVTRAAAELEAIAQRLEKLYPDSNMGRRFRAMPGHEYMIGEYSHQYVLMLLGAVSFVLLIACANVANLQFARATGRSREVAVRTALGAGRWRLIVQLVTESTMLCVLGAVLGLLIANWGLDLIRGGMPAEIERYIPGWKEIHLDGRTLAFTLAAAVMSGILAGLVPSWQCTRPNLGEALKEGGRGSSAGRARHRLRTVLVGAEIALSVVLLIGASLMVRGFSNLMGGNNHMDPSTFLTMRLSITQNRYPENHQVNAFYREAVDRVAALPGVQATVAVTAIPYSQHSNSRLFTMEGRPPTPGDQPWAMFQAVSGPYFRTLHISLRTGRLLSDSDGADTPLVAVVSELFVRRWFPGEPWPIGKHIKLGASESRGPWITIVGVVGDVVHSVWDRGPRPTLYVPFAQSPQRWMDIGVRTAGDPLRLVPAVTAAIRSVDSAVPITQMRTMEISMRREATGLTYVAVMMGIFGVLALVLSVVGVYGVMAYLVAEQTHDIGIRVALGASHQSVLAMIFRHGLLTTFEGLSVGVAAAYGLARLLASLIFGVTTQDPVTFAAIPLALIASAALAIYIPARRAIRIDPLVALRYE